MANIDPGLLQLILSSQGYGGTDLQGRYNSPEGPGGSALYTGSNGGGYYVDPTTGQIIEVGQGSNRNVYDRSGQFLNAGKDTGPTEDKMLAMLIASGLGGAYAGGAFGGAGAAGGAAGAAGAEAGSITLPTMAELGVAPATAEGLLGTMPAVNIGGAAAAGGALGSTGANAMRAGEIANYSTNGAMPSSAAVQAGTTGAGLLDGMNTGKALATLAGTVAGAASGKDQTQSTNRDPWGPAQPFLKSLLDQGQQLQQQYQQNPFSDAQKQAYNNWGGLLNAANQAAPGLLQGMQFNAGGSNAYDRTNPRARHQTTTPQFSWNPGLLNFFPPKG